MSGAEACAADEDGYTALHWAAAIGTPDVMPRLAAAGVGVNTVCREGEAPLHRAARLGWSECVEELLKADANKSICNHNGRTPRDLATAKGQTAVEHLLGDAVWSNDVRDLHASLEKRVQEALDELRLGRDDDEPPPAAARNLPPDHTNYSMDDDDIMGASTKGMDL